MKKPGKYEVGIFLCVAVLALIGGTWGVVGAQGSVPPVPPAAPPPVPVLIPVRGGVGVPMIVAGLGHTCMTVEDGRVLCWGLNESGQVGDGTFTDQIVPAYVLNLDNVFVLTAGSMHTCALTDDGEVWCWGENSSGQLGDGSAVNSSVPVMVKDLPDKVVSFTGGQDFTCAQLANNQVWCWGKNDIGQLNDGTTIDQSKPVKIGFEEAHSKISAGQTILLSESISDGVAEWGNLIPAEISDLGFSLSLSANRFASGGCALFLGGTVGCWGADLNSSDIDGVSTAFLVRIGLDHSCAVNTDLTVSCWGSNPNGELGNGTTTDSTSATLANYLGNVADLAVGAHHTCVLLNYGGRAKCWGENSFGQLGNNSNNDSSVPKIVFPPSK